MNITRKDLESLVRYVNLVTEKASFNLTAKEALEYAQLVIQLKDLKDKLEYVTQKGNS